MRVELTRFLVSGIRCFLVGVVSVWILSFTDLLADGIPKGKIVFYPSLELDFLSEDNVFLQNEQDPSIGVKPSAQQYYKATFKLEIPFSQSRTSITYSPRFRDYSSDAVSIEDRVSHYFHLDSELNFSDGLRLSFTERFLRDNVSVQELDEGGEVRFGTDNFIMNHAGVGVEYPLLPKHLLGGEIRSFTTRFSDRGNPSFFDSRGFDLYLRYEYDLLPTRNLRFEYRYGSTDQDRPNTTFSAQSEDFVENALVVGFRGRGRRDLSYDLAAGFGTLRFQESQESDFSGLIADFNFTVLLGPRLTFQGGVSRDPFPSFFDAPNFYISNRVKLSLEHQLGRRFFWNAEVSSRWNHYPDPVPDPPVFPSHEPSKGRRRKDRVHRLELGLGVQVLRVLSAGLTLRHERSDSNIEAENFLTGARFQRFDYDATAVGLQVKFGWF